MRKLILSLLLAPLLAFAIPPAGSVTGVSPLLSKHIGLSKSSLFANDAPVLGIQDVGKDSLVLSWTIPAGGQSTVIERSTNRDFTPFTTVYSDANTAQLKVETGLTPHTWYYYRARSIYAGAVSSAWAVDSVRTFWTPTASSQGGNRVATSADLAIDPDIRVGDYLVVGSDSYAESDGWGASIGGWQGLQIPKLTTPGAMVRIIGDAGYDFINIDVSLNPGITITNTGGQIKGRLIFQNMKRVLFTGKNDRINRTGNPRYPGFDGAWDKLSGSFGFFIKGRWDHPEILLSHMGGVTDSSTFEYMEAGMGGSSAFSIKNDGGSVPMIGNEIRWLYVHDTGDEAFYVGSTQSPPQTPITSFYVHDILIARAGLNSYQMGNMKGQNRIKRFATVGGGFEFNNAFMKWQDQSMQFQPRNDGFQFDSSLVVGGSGDMLNWYQSPEVGSADNPQLSQTTHMRNNLWYDNKSRGFGFLQIRNAFKGTTNFSDNYIGRLGSNKTTWDNYRQLYYQDSLKRNYAIGSISDANVQVNLNSVNTTYDTSLNQPLGAWVQATTGATITRTGDNYVNNIPTLQFNNYMDHMVDTAYALPERWMDLQGTKWVKQKLNQVGGYRDSRFGTSFEKIMIDNRSTSLTSISPVKNNTITATVGTNRKYQVGESLWFFKDYMENNALNFLAHINSYNSGTGSVNLTIDSVTGSGSYSNWAVQHEIQTIQLRRIYHAGAIVRHNGRFYLSLQNNNVSHEPPATGSDTWWKLIIFSNGRTMPPDDLRLEASSFYAQKGMGLSATVNATGVAAPTAFSGNDQEISATSITLNGIAAPASGYSITGYNWQKISGPGTTSMPNPNNATVTATGLVEGTYVFRFTVTQSDNQTAFDDVQVTVVFTTTTAPAIKMSKKARVIFK